jgi:hypothetical protein
MTTVLTREPPRGALYFARTVRDAVRLVESLGYTHHHSAAGVMYFWRQRGAALHKVSVTPHKWGIAVVSAYAARGIPANRYELAEHSEDGLLWQWCPEQMALRAQRRRGVR